jgi:cell division protein FtsX
MMPFIIQAVVLGFTGAAISTLLIGATYYSAISGLKDMMPFLPFIESKTLIFKLAFMLITCGSLISFLSGMFAAQSFVSRASKPL